MLLSGACAGHLCFSPRRSRSCSAPSGMGRGNASTPIASIAVDFHIAEVVDDTQVVAGKIPKNLFMR